MQIVRFRQVSSWMVSKAETDLKKNCCIPVYLRPQEFFLSAGDGQVQGYLSNGWYCQLERTEGDTRFPEAAPNP